MLSCQIYAIKYYTIYALLANPENKLQEDWKAVKFISITFQQQYFLAKRGRRPRVAGFIILSLKGLRRDEISCGVSVIFIPREARPKASRSGVYNFVPQRAQAG